MAQATKDWRTYRPDPEHNKLLITIGRGAARVGIGIAIGWLLFSEDGGDLTNLYTEGVSVLLTVLVLNFLSERREDHRREKDLQERLVMDAGSQVNATART